MRLIDADALYAKFEKAAWYNNADRDEVAEPLLLDAPTVDAVPVVRCWNCKNGKHCRDGYVLCRHPSGRMLLMRSSDFCSFGEKRKDGDSDER